MRTSALIARFVIAEISRLRVFRRTRSPATISERARRGAILCTTEARDRKRGTPQGAASPLLANLYFRRFLPAWYAHGHSRRLDAQVVNDADDLVICCRPGNGAE